MGFFTTVTLFIFVGYFYSAWRLTRGLMLSRKRMLAVYVTVLLLALLSISGMIFKFTGLNFQGEDALAVISFLLVGSASILVAFLLLRDLLYVVLATLSISAAKYKKIDPDQQPFDLNRRRLFIRSTNALVSGAAFATTGLGIYEAQKLARVEYVPVSVVDLHPDLVGFKIVQLSDIHVGPTVRRSYVAEIVQAVSSLGADLIAITGDLVDGRVTVHAEEIAPLADLSAPYGTYFVTGNHEYYAGVLPWIREISRLGADVLLNEHRTLQHKNARINIAGITDRKAGQRMPGHKSDPAGAIQGAGPADFNLLLAHRPWSAVDAKGLGFDLMLCGHTHGGQYFPWNFTIDFFHPYTRGLNLQRDDMDVYVSRGTGYWGPPLRAGVPAEITLLELNKA